MHRLKISLSCLLTLALLAGNSVLALDSPALSIARQLNEAFIEVADNVSPAVVIIEVTERVRDADDEGSWWDLLPPDERPPRHRHRRNNKPRVVQGEGSGVIISEDGYILTNDHVVGNAFKIVVRFKDGRTYDAVVKGTDPESDIAVIKIDAKGLTPAKLGDSDATRVGEFVVAIGAPFALSYSVTYGHVSAKGRSFEAETPSGYADQDFIQTDASINPGNSGGPLVNLYGEVIAINTMIEGMNTGIGFAVPINLAKRVKDHLIAEGRFTRSWIGVGIDELRGSPDYMNLDTPLAPNIDDGVVITEIKPNSPASRSDFQLGDVVIAVDGKTIKTARQLKDAIALQPPGRYLAFKVVRGRQQLSFKVQTEALPSDSGAVAERKQPESINISPSFGLSVEATTRDVADEYGVKPGSGVVVTSVERDSPADDKHIEPGDIITEINRQPVGTPQQFHKVLNSGDSKKGMMIKLIKAIGGASQLVVLRADGE